MNGKRLWPGGPLFQDAAQMRLTTDSILLADFAAVRSGEKGADLGCGSGLLMLLLLWRESGLQMTGLEIQPEALRLAEENLRLNGLQERAALIAGDLRETVKTLPNGGFDFVISNPPYFPPESGRMPSDAARELARGETALKLPELCAAASRLCRSGGRVCFCHRPERMVSLLQEMRLHHLEPKRMRLVHPFADREPNLVLIECVKGGRPRLAIDPPLVVYREPGIYTDEVLEIYGNDRG